MTWIQTYNLKLVWFFLEHRTYSINYLTNDKLKEGIWSYSTIVHTARKRNYTSRFLLLHIAHKVALLFLFLSKINNNNMI